MKNTLFFVGVLFLSTNAFGQKTSEPGKVKTEKKGVETQAANGNATSAEGQIISTEGTPSEPKPLSELTVAEIDELLLIIDTKIKELNGTNEVEFLRLLEEKRKELEARRASLVR